jgi:heme A synthase
MNGSLFPPLTDANSAHVLHRWVAVVVGLIVAAGRVVAWRTQRGHRRSSSSRPSRRSSSRSRRSSVGSRS